MVKAVIQADHNGHLLEIKGHAGYGRSGADIVCAGVSAVAFSLLGYLHNLPGVRVDAEEHPGDLRIACGFGDNVREAYRLTAIGLSQISKTYPEHVQVTLKGI